MPTPARRRGPDPDPVRQHLVDVRRGLFRLHKALIDAERSAFERDRGPTTSGQFLQALIHDEYFAWLRPFSGLIVEMDEALAPKESLPPTAVRAYVARAHALVEPGDSGLAQRYESVCARNSDVLLAHLELGQRIEDALAATGGEG